MRQVREDKANQEAGTTEMSTRFDIVSAKRRVTDHVASHQCIIGDGCPERLSLFRQWRKTADLWGKEPDDAERQRLQYQVNQAS